MSFIVVMYIPLCIITRNKGEYTLVTGLGSQSHMTDYSAPSTDALDYMSFLF